MLIDTTSITGYTGEQSILQQTKTRTNKTPKQTANETLLLSLQRFNLHSESQREASPAVYYLPQRSLGGDLDVVMASI